MLNNNNEIIISIPNYTSLRIVFSCAMNWNCRHCIKILIIYIMKHYPSMIIPTFYLVFFFYYRITYNTLLRTVFESNKITVLIYLQYWFSGTKDIIDWCKWVIKNGGLSKLITEGVYNEVPETFVFIPYNASNSILAAMKDEEET